MIPLIEQCFVSYPIMTATQVKVGNTERIFAGIFHRFNTAHHTPVGIQYQIHFRFGDMACLSNGDFASLVDAHLYLPQDWIDDPVRYDKVGIPEERREFKTKPELAAQIVENQINLGVEFDFVGADGLYGNDLVFVNYLDDMGCVYILDIHKDQRIFFVLLQKQTINSSPAWQHTKKSRMASATSTT